MAPHLFYLIPTLVKIGPHLLLTVVPETNLIQQQQQNFAHGIASSVRFLGKRLYGLYWDNPTWLQSAGPCRTSLFMVICKDWSQPWMHLLVKGHLSVSHCSLWPLAAEMSAGSWHQHGGVSSLKQETSLQWKLLAVVSVPQSASCPEVCMSPWAVKLLVLKAKNMDFHFRFWLNRIKLLP